MLSPNSFRGAAVATVCTACSVLRNVRWSFVVSPQHINGIHRCRFASTGSTSGTGSDSKDQQQQTAAADSSAVMSSIKKHANQVGDERREFRQLQELAESERRTFENAAAFAQHSDDFRQTLLGAMGDKTMVWTFDRDMQNDLQQLPDLSLGMPRVVSHPPPHHRREPRHTAVHRQPLASKEPPRFAEKEEKSSPDMDQMATKMIHSIRQVQQVPEPHRMESLSPYMGAFIFDTFEPQYTPWDFIHLKEQQQPWRRQRLSEDLPPAVFFAAKSHRTKPAKGAAENFEDEMEDLFMELRNMPPQPRVMRMAELKNLRIRRGMQWAHEHRPADSAGQ